MPHHVSQWGALLWHPIHRLKVFTQGNLLSHTIFNKVAGAFICHWVTVAYIEDVDPEGFGRAVQKLAILLYANDGLIAYLSPARLQESLEVLMVLFERVGLQTNMDNRFGMICQP